MTIIRTACFSQFCPSRRKGAPSAIYVIASRPITKSVGARRSRFDPYTKIIWPLSSLELRSLSGYCFQSNLTKGDSATINHSLTLMSKLPYLDLVFATFSSLFFPKWHQFKAHLEEMSRTSASKVWAVFDLRYLPNSILRRIYATRIKQNFIYWFLIFENRNQIRLGHQKWF